MGELIEREYISCGDRVYSFPWNPETLHRDAAWKEDIARRQAELADALRGSTEPVGSCPICGYQDASPFAEIYGFTYGRCHSCGHLFLQQQPTPEAVIELYSATSEEVVPVHMLVYSDPRVAEVRIEAIAAPKVKFVSERVSQKGRWLDIGCGTGEILVAATRAGWDAVGVESDVPEVGFARNRGCSVEEAYVTTQNAAVFVEGAKVVSLFNVLEHVPKPIELVSAVASALPSGGWMVIEVPRHPSISSFANRAYPMLAHRHIYPPDHLHIFTEKSAQELLEQAGIVPRAIWVFGQDFSEIVYSMASSSKGSIDVGQEVRVEDLNATQAAIDRQGLSDKMIILCERE